MLVAPGAYPRRKHLKGLPFGFALALPSNSKTQLERVTKGKPSSLLGLVVSDEGNKFYNIDTCRMDFSVSMPLSYDPSVLYLQMFWSRVTFNLVDICSNATLSLFSLYGTTRLLNSHLAQRKASKCIQVRYTNFDKLLSFFSNNALVILKSVGGNQPI